MKYVNITPTGWSWLSLRHVPVKSKLDSSSLSAACCCNILHLNLYIVLCVLANTLKLNTLYLFFIMGKGLAKACLLAKVT